MLGDADDVMVTVLIPARNEGRWIGTCLEAVKAQDYPHTRMEVVVVDGDSEDETRRVAATALQTATFRSEIIHCPGRTTPLNLNAGLAVAQGDVVCRVDARSVIPPDYVRLCAQTLSQDASVVVTGGAQIATPGGDGLVSRGISRALNNRLSMGGASYRSSGHGGPTDTVYLGAFRTSDLRSVGGWDPYFRTNQDFDLNRRLAGRGVVWFDSRLAVRYVARPSVGKLAAQYFRFGRWKARYWRRRAVKPLPRQWVAISLPASALLVTGLLLSRRHRLKHAALLAGVGSGALLLIDHVGNEAPASRSERLISAACIAVVSFSWPSGIAFEVAAGTHAST